MRFHRSIALCFGLVSAVAACQGAATPPQMPAVVGATPQSNAIAAVRRGAGAIAIVLPVISSGGFVAGTQALSKNTRSVGGTLGKKALVPIALSPSTDGCAAVTGGLQCTIFIRTKPGTRTISLKTYATTNATGRPLAQASASATVYPGKQNYVALTWTGLAQKLTAVVSPAPLLQGRSTLASITAYAVDASGAIIPSTQIAGPNGAVQNIWAIGTGPYYFKLTHFMDNYYQVGESLPFAYDGLLAGTESVTVGAGGSGLNSPAVSWPIAASTPGPSAKMFVQSSEFYYNGLDSFDAVYQFAGAAAQGPLSTLRITTTLTAAQDDGSYWGNSQTAFYHYSAGGAVLGYIPAIFPSSQPDDPPQIAAATVDARGNVYVVDQEPGPANDLGERAPGAFVLNEYAAGGYPSAPLRTVQLVTATDIYAGQLAVDGSGNIYLYYRTSSAFAVEEIGTGAISDASPLRTIATGLINKMSVDAAGDVFLADYGGGGGEIDEYAVNGSTKVVASGDGLHSFIGTGATDAVGNCYVLYGYDASGNANFAASIVEYPAGSTSPTTLVSTTNTEIPGLPDGQPIAVAP